MRCFCLHRNVRIVFRIITSFNNLLWDVFYHHVCCVLCDVCLFIWLRTRVRFRLLLLFNLTLDIHHSFRYLSPPPPSTTLRPQAIQWKSTRNRNNYRREREWEWKLLRNECGNLEMNFVELNFDLRYSFVRVEASWQRIHTEILISFCRSQTENSLNNIVLPSSLHGSETRERSNVRRYR